MTNKRPKPEEIITKLRAAVRRMRTRIRLQAQPEPMHSRIEATQSEQRFD